jgi:hypothetical protein
LVSPQAPTGRYPSAVHADTVRAGNRPEHSVGGAAGIGSYTLNPIARVACARAYGADGRSRGSNRVAENSEALGAESLSLHPDGFAGVVCVGANDPISTRAHVIAFDSIGGSRSCVGFAENADAGGAIVGALDTIREATWASGFSVHARATRARGDSQYPNGDTGRGGSFAHHSASASTRREALNPSGHAGIGFVLTKNANTLVAGTGSHHAVVDSRWSRRGALNAKTGRTVSYAPHGDALPGIGLANT